MTRFEESIRLHIRAGYPILYVVTSEEERAIRQIQSILGTGEDRINRDLYLWYYTKGLMGPDHNIPNTNDPREILVQLKDAQSPGVFVLHDFHFFFDERWENRALIVRQLRDLASSFMETKKTLILLSSVLTIPFELEKEITVIDLELPRKNELSAIIQKTIEGFQDQEVELDIDDEGREKLVTALLGLTQIEAENALVKIVIKQNSLSADDAGLLIKEKAQTIRKAGLLEYYDKPEEFDQSIGGLENLHCWLQQRSEAYSQKAREFGLPNPKGLLLVGIPGCGKSLCAKAIAAEWQMPLLKFDIGRVYGKYVGDSEQNLRRAIDIAESLSPVVLWVDEIEKGLSFARGYGNDSGVSARVFGSLLTWMEEKESPVFVVATANDVSAIPPELLRKGRFDDIFFVDLPNREEREAIFRIHLSKHHRSPEDFDIRKLAIHTEGFSGAEIESAVVSALCEAFAAGGQVLEDGHLLRSIGGTFPQSRSEKEKFDDMRREAKRWKPASKSDTNLYSEKQTSMRALEI